MKKSRTTAAILGLLGGWIGADRFYLGQHQLGLFLVFMTFIGLTAFGLPIAGLIGFIHAIQLLMSSDEQFDRKYNKEHHRRRQRASQTRAQQENRRASRELREMDMQRKQYAYKSKAKTRTNPFVTSGRKKYKEYDLEGAISDYNQALELSPDNPQIHLDMSAIYSIREETDKCLYHMNKAISLGVKKEKFLQEDDFAYIRIQPEFESFKENGFKLDSWEESTALPEAKVKDDKLLTHLNKLKNLRDRGLLSEKEFLYEKEKLGRR